MRKPPRRPKRYHHGDLPRALLDAALHIVETQGTEALTLRAAARSAGVSQAAPYRHFTNKEAILAAVAEEGFRSLMGAIRQATAAGEGPLGRLRGVGIGYVTFATSHPSHFRVMFGREMADRSASPSLRRLATETFERLGVARYVIGKKFQRDEAPQFGVFGLVDNTHAAAAQLLKDAVM